MPKTITNKAIVTYILALIACSVLYMQYALTWYWVLFGLIEVVGFFYFSNKLTKEWSKYSPQYFAKKLFWTALIIRVVYVLFSYWFYYEMTGTYFDFAAGDVLYYDAAAEYCSQIMSKGIVNIYPYLNEYAGNDVQIADSGYIIYLSVMYLLTDHSILIVRLIKALLSAYTCVLMYKIASRNFGESIGRVTGIMCMLMTNLIMYCGFHLKETEMIFVLVLSVEKMDVVLKESSIKFSKLAFSLILILSLFTMRTALGAVVFLSVGLTLILSDTKKVARWKKWIIGSVCSLMILFTAGSSIVSETKELWENKDTNQIVRLESRANAKGGNSWSTKASVAIFAPMVFTIPFPTMVDINGQENQQMMHGGYWVKNITSIFTIFALFVLLLSGDWKKFVLPICVLCGYLAVIALSAFAQSERFHLPALPFSLMFAAYGMSMINAKNKYKIGYRLWCILMIFAAISWNWFKLAGRGLLN